MARQPRNIAASVRRRLTIIARSTGEDFQYVLTRYGLERLLYRLSVSPHADRFVLKGAVLFQLWSDQPHRPTRDVDLLGYGDPSAERLERVFKAVCAESVEDDGLVFLPASAKAVPIKENDEYQGIRLRVQARLENARIHLQADIGFGDAVTPGPIEVAYPTYLPFPQPVLNAYPRDTVVTEKYQAMVMLGITNSRMKDFYDVWFLARQFEFDGPTLSRAMQATFNRRRTELPKSTPLSFSAEFYEDQNKQTQWRTFITRNGLTAAPSNLRDVAALLTEFLLPPSEAAAADRAFELTWQPGGPWVNMEQ